MARGQRDDAGALLQGGGVPSTAHHHRGQPRDGGGLNTAGLVCWKCVGILMSEMDERKLG